MANIAVDTAYSPEMNNTIANIMIAAVTVSLCKFFMISLIKLIWINYIQLVSDNNNKINA